jgi:hypothetical protein
MDGRWRTDPLTGREPRWWDVVAKRFGPETLAAVLTVTALILFLVVLAVLVASGR